MKKYTPISCSVYDHLEIFAMRQIPVTIVLLTGETYTACIETLETRKNEGEFMLLSGGKTYRLDTVKSVGGVEVGGKTCSV